MPDTTHAMQQETLLEPQLNMSGLKLLWSQISLETFNIYFHDSKSKPNSIAFTESFGKINCTEYGLFGAPYRQNIVYDTQ